MEENGFKLADVFFVILRCALWGSEEALPHVLSEKQAKRILLFAKQQTVAALVADVLVRNNLKLPREVVFDIIVVTNQIRQINQQVNDELKQFVALPLKNYVVVKGQTVASLYPNPSLRMPGDIDFLVGDYQESKCILNNEWGIELPEMMVDKEFSFQHGGILYEIHSSLVEFGSRRHRRYWKELMKRPCAYAEVDGTEVPTLEPTIYAVYIFLHLFFHFIREGVGLRQMCDWAMMLYHYREKIDHEELGTILKGLGMKKAYCAFGAILVDRLGLKHFPLAITSDNRRLEQYILRDILHGGNFGQQARRRGLHGWEYKAETALLTMRNCWRYFSLAPKELLLMVPRLTWLNIKLVFK